MKFVHKNAGTCSTQVEFEIEAGIIKHIQFRGGCNGNMQGISRLAEGRNAKEVAEIIKGINCGFKKTSCPDQLARAIEEALGEVDSQPKQA
jgi:uncharacterized protein (TIGR03905 family)